MAEGGGLLMRVWASRPVQLIPRGPVSASSLVRLVQRFPADPAPSGANSGANDPTLGLGAYA